MLKIFWHFRIKYQVTIFFIKKFPKKLGPLCLKTFWHFCTTKLQFFQIKKKKRHLVVHIGQMSWMQPIAQWGNGIRLCGTEHRNHIAIT
jgi:hypothetical protein